MIIGASAVAGLRALGGSYAENHIGVQFPNQGSISKTLLGMAMRGRYGSPGSGLYQFVSCMNYSCQLATINNLMRVQEIPLRSVEGKVDRQS